MDGTIRLFAGECTLTYQGESETAQRGSVLTLVKPDNTVLVHDAHGYQPAAWLTRAESVQLSGNGTAFTLTARSDGSQLTVRSHQGETRTSVPASPAGTDVGECPDCGRVLIRNGGAVSCTGCLTRWGLPRDAALSDETCSQCGLPELSVTRGAEFQICIDYACDPLDSAVADRFEGAWDCPDCSVSMTIERVGTLQAVCEDCGADHTIPAGSTVGTCTCGLPLFETVWGRRCLDSGCEGQAGEQRGDPAP